MSTILGQIAQSAPGAPDFHIIDMADWHIVQEGNTEQQQGITYQACPALAMSRGQVASALVQDGRMHVRDSCM